MASMQLEAALWCPYPSGSRQMAALVRHEFIKQFRNSSVGVPLGYMDCGHAASYWLCRVDASPGVTLCYVLNQFGTSYGGVPSGDMEFLRSIASSEWVARTAGA